MYRKLPKKINEMQNATLALDYMYVLFKSVSSISERTTQLYRRWDLYVPIAQIKVFRCLYFIY